MKLVLIGYMGSGKTSVGKHLASKLNFLFYDLDKEIETRVGQSIAQIFSEKGEIYFRKIESELVRSITHSKEKLILATGGGTPCYGDTMKNLLSCDNVITIYLKTSLQILTDRLYKEKSERPLIAHITTRDVLNDFIRKHLFERSHYYYRALITINVDELSVSEISEAIILKLF